MLEAFKYWFGSAGAARAGGGWPHADRRGHERYSFAGAEVFLFIGPEAQCHRLRLKDLSCTGVSGLTDAPLDVGTAVIVQLEELVMPAASVTWARRSVVGLKLADPLDPACLKRLHRRHHAGAAWSPAMRMRPDFAPGWPFFTARAAAARNGSPPPPARP